MDIATKCQTHSEGLHYGREHIEREIYNEKGYSIGAELFEEIVRCKDCKHKYVSGNGTTQYYVCDFMDAQFEDEGYCHHGKRREE